MMTKLGALFLALSISVAGTLSGCAQVGEQRSPDRIGEPGEKTGRQINNEGRENGKGRSGSHRSSIGDDRPPITPTKPGPATEPSRAPAVNAPSPDDIQGYIPAFSETLDYQFRALTADQRAELGIGSAAQHPTAKSVSGFGVILELGNFFVALATIDNANAARESFRRTLEPGKKEYLLYRYNGAGQLETWPVKSMNDTPMDWNPKTMFIEPVTGLAPDTKRIYDTASQAVQAKYLELEKARTASKPVSPSKLPPKPRPRPCSGKSCVRNPM